MSAQARYATEFSVGANDMSLSILSVYKLPLGCERKFVIYCLCIMYFMFNYCESSQRGNIWKLWKATNEERIKLLFVTFRNFHNNVAIAEYTVSVSSGGHIARTEGASVVEMPHQLVLGEARSFKRIIIYESILLPEYNLSICILLSFKRIICKYHCPSYKECCMTESSSCWVTWYTIISNRCKAGQPGMLQHVPTDTFK